MSSVPGRLTGAFGRLVRHNIQKSTASLKKANPDCALVHLACGLLCPGVTDLLLRCGLSTPVSELLVIGLPVDGAPPTWWARLSTPQQIGHQLYVHDRFRDTGGGPSVPAGRKASLSRPPEHSQVLPT